MIEGNTTAVLQVSITTKNEIGESVKAWHDVWSQNGWIDLSSGDSKHTTYNSKIQESTHVFICDYKAISGTFTFGGKTVKVSAESTRMVANSQAYDVMLIDDPMELHQQLEIYLKFTGGQ